MGGQRLSFEDEPEQERCSEVQTDPIHMNPYQQTTWEQAPFPDASGSPLTDKFSQTQITGEKLVPQRSAFGMSTFMKLIPPACIFLLLLFALLGGGHVFQDIVSTRTIQSQQMSINQSAHIAIQNDHGRIYVHGGNVAAITVRSTQFEATGASSQSNATTTDTRVVEDGNLVLVTALRSDGTSFQNGQKVDLDITVPAQADLQVTAPQGTVTVDGMNGGLHIEARDSISAQRISSTHGQMVFLSQAGSIELTHVSGQVEGSALQGYISLHDGHLFGRSRLRTESGKLTFDGNLDPYGAYSFATQSGGIDVSLQPSTSFDLHLFADQDLVNNEFGDTLMGPPPRAQLGIATLTGSVEIKQEH